MKKKALKELVETLSGEQGKMLVAASIKTLRAFLKAHPDIRRPSVVLPPTGSVWGFWGAQKAPYVEVEFLEHGALSLLYSVGSAKGLVPTTVDGFRARAKFLNLLEVIKKND